MFFKSTHSLVEDLREDLDALRMTVVSYGQEMKELKEKIHQHQVGRERGREGGTHHTTPPPVCSLGL